MRKTILAAASLTAVFGSFSANAADLAVRKAPVAVMAPAPYYNWGGFYIGGHIGGLWSDKKFGSNINEPGTTCEWEWYKDEYCEPVAARNLAIRRGYEVDGFLAGGQIGYNWHLSPNWVIGVEGQISWTNADGDGRFDTLIPGESGRISTEFNWIATATGRLGYAVNNMLFYVKGGAAWVDEDHHLGFTGPGGSIHLGSVGDTRSGWTIGGGVEYGFGNNWSAKLEYNFMDFGSDRHTVSHVDFGSHSFDIDQQVHVVKFGINYRFGWANPVVAARY